MKVGEYVRTKDGNIFQIMGSDIEFASEIGSDGNLPFNAKIISSKIIDLIEEGDYVNGRRVLMAENNEIIFCPSAFGVMMALRNKDIKTIVTKEQFSQMEYKIGE